MAAHSGIEWTDATWNPVTGCSVVSPGCANCYAMKSAGTRLKHHPSRRGLTTMTRAGPVWTGDVRFNAGWLTQPLLWKTPRRIFVCAHGDLFHERVPDEWIDRIFAVMALAPCHTFQVLTKRAERLREYVNARWQPTLAQTLDMGGGTVVTIPAETSGQSRAAEVAHACAPLLETFGLADPSKDELWDETGSCAAMRWDWPLPNVWLGVSVEDQTRANERIPFLLDTMAAKRFLSCEPLLGPVDLNRLYSERTFDGGGLEQRWDSCLSTRRFDPWCGGEADGAPRVDWVITGGESGAAARPSNPQWFRDIGRQCGDAGVAWFHKQNGEYASVSEFEGRGEHFVFPDHRTVRRVGKKIAGALLDGRTHRAFPA